MFMQTSLLVVFYVAHNFLRERTTLFGAAFSCLLGIDLTLSLIAAGANGGHWELNTPAVAVVALLAVAGWAVLLCPVASVIGWRWRPDGAKQADRRSEGALACILISYGLRFPSVGRHGFSQYRPGVTLQNMKA
jgi:hypothetical protein